MVGAVVNIRRHDADENWFIILVRLACAMVPYVPPPPIRQQMCMHIPRGQRLHMDNDSWHILVTLPDFDIISSDIIAPRKLTRAR
jgi:hypothetical protein